MRSRVRPLSAAAIVSLTAIALFTIRPTHGGWGQNDDHDVIPLWSAPYRLSGQGFVLGMWEGATPLVSHPELLYRTSVGEVAPGAIDHATHVAGTLIGVGASPSDPTISRGAAYLASLQCWDWFDIVDESAAAAATGHVAGNHSYSAFLGWWYDSDPSGIFGPGWRNSGGQDFFGQYLSDTQGIDQVVYDAAQFGNPYFVCFPAGDDRNDGPGNLAHDGTWFPDYPHEHPYFDTISPFATGKNTMTVGATDRSPNLGEIMPYSSWGPTNDGRIKPDLVARGERIYSATVSATSLYENRSGTDHACPVVTGTAVLLMEQYRRFYDELPGTAEVKALLINGAEDRGPAGPDYLYGFGFMNARAAVDTVVFDSGDRTLIRAGTVEDASTVTYPLRVVDSDETVKVTLVWIDPPGSLATEGALVNDLDLRLTAPSATVHLPYRLTPGDPPALALTDAPNRADTVEQVVVEQPEPGLWQVDVVGHDVTESSPQRFALVSNTPLHAGAPEPTGVVFTLNVDEQSVDVSWDPVADPALAEHRIYRTAAIGQSLERIATLPAGTFAFTDAAPPVAGLLAYDVRAVYDRAGVRVVSDRPHAFQNRTPTVLLPGEGDVVSHGGMATSIIGRADPGSTVTMFDGELELGTTLTGANGMFHREFNFGGNGGVTIWARALGPDGRGVSVPSPEIGFDLVP